MTVAPMFVTVVPPRTVKLAAAPRGGATPSDDCVDSAFSDFVLAHGQADYERELAVIRDRLKS